MSPIAWIIALAVTAFAAALQGVVGMGFAMVSVPLLALVDPRLAPVPQLLVILPLTLAMAWRERHHLDLSGVGWIIGGRIPGAVLGLGLLAVATPRILDVAIALLVLVAVAIIASGYHLARSPGTEVAAGVFSGASALVASIGGPPLALLYTEAESGTTRSSLAVVFSVGIVVTIVARASGGYISAEDVRVALVLFPALVLGFFVSGRLKDHFDRNRMRLAILLLSGLGAVGLLLRALA